MSRYKLTKDIPGFPKGTIFEYREYDKERDLGSVLGGYLTNVWIDGNAQDDGEGSAWCAETHIFPGQLKDSKWFKKIGSSKSKKCQCNCCEEC